MIIGTINIKISLKIYKAIMDRILKREHNKSMIALRIFKNFKKFWLAKINNNHGIWKYITSLIWVSTLDIQKDSSLLSRHKIFTKNLIWRPKSMWINLKYYLKTYLLTMVKSSRSHFKLNSKPTCSGSK